MTLNVNEAASRVTDQVAKEIISELIDAAEEHSMWGLICSREYPEEHTAEMEARFDAAIRAVWKGLTGKTFAEVDPADFIRPPASVEVEPFCLQVARTDLRLAEIRRQSALKVTGHVST